MGRGKGLGFLEKRTHPSAWFPRRQYQRFLWAVKSRHGPGCRSPACHKCHVPRKFDQLPLESLHFLPETRFFSRQCQQARESRIQPPICVRNLFGKNKEDAGAEGATSLPARARPGVRAGHPVRLCLCRDSSIRQPSCPTGDWDSPTIREKSVPPRGPIREPESPVSRRDPPVGTGHLEGGTGLDSALCLIEPSGSLTGHSEAPAPTWPPKSPHLEQS